MRKFNLKTLILIIIFVVSVISIPAIVFGQEDDDLDEDEGSAGAFQDFHGGFGGIFSENMGYGGDMIGQLFEVLLLDGIDFNDNEAGEGIYVLSATDTEVYTGEYDFVKEGDTEEIHYLPFVDFWNISAIKAGKGWPEIHNPDYKNDYNETQIEGIEK